MTRTLIVCVAMFLMLPGCASDRSVERIKELTRKNPALRSLVFDLEHERSIEKQVILRKRIYALGQAGRDFLVEGVADLAFHDKIVISADASNDFFVRIRTFVDVQNGKEKELFQLNAEIDARIMDDDKYLNRFIRAWSPGGIGMEGCIDELMDETSSPVSRRIAHRYLRDYEQFTLAYDPTSPVDALPADISDALVKWKKDHYEGSFWQEWDVMDAEFEAEMNPPALTIAEDDVPEPVMMPFKDAQDKEAYRQYYKRGYFKAANIDGLVGFSCCLGKTPNRKAKISGHYAGVSDANDAKVKAVRLRNKHQSR